MLAYFVELPQEAQLAIVGLAVVLVDLAVTAAIAYVPWLAFLEAYKEEWGLALGALAIQLLQNALPGGEYAAISILAVQLVLAILAVVMGAKKFLAKRGAAKLL